MTQSQYKPQTWDAPYSYAQQQSYAQYQQQQQSQIQPQQSQLQSQIQSQQFGQAPGSTQQLPHIPSILQSHPPRPKTGVTQNQTSQSYLVPSLNKTASSVEPAAPKLPLNDSRYRGYGDTQQSRS